MEKRLRTRLASSGVLLLVFASGAVVGMALDRTGGSSTAVAETPEDTATEQRQGSGPNAGRGRRPAIYQMVGLSDEQLEVANSLVREHSLLTRALFEAHRQETDSLMIPVWASQRRFDQQTDSLGAELRTKLRAIMTPEQRVDYDAGIRARQEAEERRRSEREEREGRTDNRP